MEILLILILFLLLILNWRFQQFFKIFSEKRDTLNPAFSRLDIEDRKKEFDLAWKQWEQKYEEQMALSKKEYKEGGFTPTEELKRLTKEEIKYQFEMDTKKKFYNFMIEGNIRVLNGEKIEKIHDEWMDSFHERFVIPPKEAEKQYDEWEKRMTKRD